MSLTSGLHSPRTPLRRFLDRELSAGARPLRESLRAQHRGAHVLQPRPGVGTEAGTVGTAIDQRLRLAFTTAVPVDAATLGGVESSAAFGRAGAGERMRQVGVELADRLADTAHTLRLEDRELPLERAGDEEEHLARLLLAAAWYQVAYRAGIGFPYTPLFLAAVEDPGDFTLKRLLDLPHPDLVADILAQVHHAADSPLAALRARTGPAQCVPGPTFPGVELAADADLLVDGLLLDFKSTRRPDQLTQHTAWQLTGYLLLDTADCHGIEAVGLYLTRSATPVSWPVEDYLALLGARCRDLPAFRTAFAALLAGCEADCEPFHPAEERIVRRLLDRLAFPTPPGCCPVCAQPLPQGHHRRHYCSRWCAVRAPTLRRHGWIPLRPA